MRGVFLKYDPTLLCEIYLLSGNSCTKDQLATLLGVVIPSEFFRFILTAGITIPLAGTVAPIIVGAAKCFLRDTEENVAELPTLN